MGTLNKNKPYGTVCGVASHIYEQDGKRFNGQGNEVYNREVEASDAALLTLKPKMPEDEKIVKRQSYKKNKNK